MSNNTTANRADHAGDAGRAEWEGREEPGGDPVIALIRVLDALDALPDFVRLRARSYDLLNLTPGASVVDVGCGTGLAVAEMAGRGARVTGVDLSELMIAEGRRREPGADLRVGDARELPFLDGELAGYRAEKLYHELDDPAGALGEARRVLAADGRVVLIGQDWDTFVIDSDTPALTRTIVHTRADLIPTPHVARAYRALLLDAGFDDVTVEVHTAVLTGPLMLPVLARTAGAARDAGAITADDADGWMAEQAERARTGRLLLAMPLFVAAARRP
ncbi:methyltransferase domain-containing protein [Streptosporangium sp. OZ121]|uniref:methyltransferase domain-containing protein n=1 Tax=Streptosporangium sp. OZ121 TaxID=3444183 RepID=UPI003F7AD42E